ncbi:MAG: hypothetical protein J5679_00960 [Alphaproteobacteria bacterium]|nr:hypothetical protein [Alphaproteobacteria bacterium]
MLFANRTDAASVRGATNVASRNGIATAQNQNVNPASSYTYNYMYPYLNNQMRTTLKPYDATSPSTSPINTVVRTEQLSAPRRVVPRPTTSTNTNTARVATGGTTARRVVARPRSYNTTQNNAGAVAGNPARSASRNTQSGTTTVNTGTVVTPAQCLADYTECMNNYCERPNTAYNRCYCSAKLAQIDAEYQPQIETLIGQIYLIRQNGTVNDSGEDITQYWEDTIKQYTGDNSWANIDDALNIDWASMESRVRGQNAFVTAHDYCAQHIRGCFYMASNLRDAYRSSIAQDCAAYQNGLERLKNAAESIIQGYNQ